jgi:two-component system sensor histidine kinase RegB
MDHASSKNGHEGRSGPVPPQAAGVVDDAGAVQRINVSWLVKLRWAAILGQAIVIAEVRWGFSMALPLASLGAILGVELLANLAFEAWLRTSARVSERVVAAALAFDVACFTGLLYFTGGPFNPFSFLYLVHIALAALVLRPRWTWTLVLLSVAANAGLFARHVPLPMEPGAAHSMHDMQSMQGMHGMHDMQGMHGGQGGEPLDVHLRGMWVAFAVAAAFIVYFITRVTRALSNREAELARAREIAARSEKLASMATLAAGAAHELATPLSTIAVVARELERATDPSTLSTDAKLIREQVERCRDILGQMSGGAGVSPGEMAEESSPAVLVRLALEPLPGKERVVVDITDGASQAKLVVPPRATSQALRNVLKNGLDASATGETILLRVAREGDTVEFAVTDRGTGMSAEVLAHATEPFFTTKEPGRGMGLGLFLTRSVVGLLGGTLGIESRAGAGTRVAMTLPSR